MTLTLKVNDAQFNDLLSITTTSAVDMFARTFSFTMSAEIFKNARINTGSSVVISADGEDVLTGFIDRTVNTYSSGGHVATINGRSKTMDLIDSTIGSELNLSGETNLKTVAETLIDVLTTITLPLFEGQKRLEIGVVVDSSVDDLLSSESIEDEIGQTYFQTLEKLARKRAVLLTDNGKGDVVFTQGKGKSSGTAVFGLQNVINGRNNNIKRATRIDDDSGLFNLYQANSQPITHGIQKILTITPSGLVIADSSAVDSSIRSSRKFVFVTENPSDGSETQLRALWEANIRRTRGFSYTAVTNGHSFVSKRLGVNKVWAPNFPVTVRDVDVEIDPSANLLINSVTLSQSVQSGEETTVVCVPDFAYNAETPEVEALIERQRLLAEFPLGPA